MTEQQESSVIAMDFPEWFDGKNVDEIVFCREFLQEHPMICVKGSFFCCLPTIRPGSWE